MKCVTFNIRCDYNQDGNNNFCYRKEAIAAKILQEKPDIIGFQEVLPHVAAWLKDTLEEYYVLGCGRDKKLEDEQTAIAFKKSQYQLIAMNTFWLSPTPLIPGSRYENQSTCPRTCTEVLLQDVTSKEMFRVLNTHLDHEGSGARIQGMEQILNYIKEVSLFKEAAVILMGDFNATPMEPEILCLQQNSDLVDVTEGLEGTFHGYGRSEENGKIDYIIVSRDLECKERGLWKDEVSGIFLSDHYPVWVELARR